jgi:hypothetical protein
MIRHRHVFTSLRHRSHPLGFKLAALPTLEALEPQQSATSRPWSSGDLGYSESILKDPGSTNGMADSFLLFFYREASFSLIPTGPPGELLKDPCAYEPRCEILDGQS